MATTLDKTRVTGPKSRLVEVHAAFDWISQTCKPEVLYDSYDVLKTTLDRFQAAREEINRAEAGGKRAETAEFRLAFTQFYETVHNYSTLDIADRVVKYKHLINTLTSYHGDRDGLSKVFQLLRDAGLSDVKAVGTEAFDRAVGAYEEKLQAQIDIFIANAEQNLVDKKALLDEAERVLIAAEGSHDPRKWAANELARTMAERVSPLAKEALTMVVNSAKPSWYMNEKEVKRDEVAFAAGSFGSVYYGTLGSHDDDEGSGAPVVVKCLKNVTDGMKEMFTKEVDLWAQLRHPYILRLFGACHNAPVPWLACEWAEKGNLLNYLTTSTGKKRQWRLLYQVALAIQYLHRKRVIHADLKLDNFLVANDGYIRVTDFGMSRLKISSNVYATSSQEAGDTAVGALRWRAPECVGADRVSAQLPSDVHSFGMCIYEALSGEPPYCYLDDGSVVLQIKDGKLPDKPAKIPDRAWDLIVEMTNSTPEERPTIQQVVRELWKFADEEQKADKEDDQGLKLFCAVCKNETKPSGCPTCGSKTSEKLIKIESKADLPRVMELLTSQSEDQRLDAMQALQTYLSLGLVQQDEVYDAGAVSVLAGIVLETDEMRDVQREAVVTLACVVIGNVAAQNLAANEKAITRLVQILRVGPDPLKNKAANSLGYMSYRNDKLFKEITQEDNLLGLVNALLDDRDKARALKMLSPAPTPVATGA